MTNIETVAAIFDIVAAVAWVSLIIYMLTNPRRQRKRRNSLKQTIDCAEN